MLLTMMKAKLHRATVTRADLDYEGSISVDLDLLVRQDARRIQQVAVDGDRAFVVEIGLGHRGAVQLGLHHGQQHGV